MSRRDLWDRPACAKALDQPAVVVLSIGMACATLGALAEAVDSFRAMGCPEDEYPLPELEAALVRVNQVIEGGWPDERGAA